jgi:amino acid transporter
MVDPPHLLLGEDQPTAPALKKTVSILHLVGIAFFLVSAGPFGQEEAIAAGGALYSFITTLVTPIIYSLPVALTASELATRFPACGGAVEWALILTKPVAIVNAYIRVIGSLFDNALYPVMVSDYLCVVFPVLDIWYWRLLMAFACVGFVVGINLAGLEAVGWTSILLSIIILLPFVLFTGFAARYMTPDRVFAQPPGGLEGANLELLFSTVIWQFSGFDTVAALSEEVKNPRRTFPIAMFLTVALITIVYLLPTIGGACIEPDLDAWEPGSFAANARKLPYCENGWLSNWISVAGAASSLSLLNAALSCNGRELYASGGLNTFPFSGWLRTMDKNLRGEPCPVRAIVLEAVLTIPFSLFDFGMLVEWSSLMLVLAQLVQIAIFIACRCQCAKHMSMRKRVEDSSATLSASQAPHYTIVAPVDNTELAGEDKFIIGGGWGAVVLCCLPPAVICGLMCYLAGWMSILMAIVFVVGFLIIKAIDTGIRMVIRKCQARAQETPIEELLRSARENDH